MTELPSWLPPLIKFNDYDGWDDYLLAIHEVFRRDFIQSKPVFDGLSVFIRHEPKFKDKEYTFWHVTSEGESEEDRIPDLRRCERIGWIRAIIDNANCEEVKVWEQVKKRRLRVYLWLHQFDYLIVLTKATEFYFLVTAFQIQSGRKRENLQRDYNTYK